MIDFALTETQKMVIETARGFGQEVLQPAERELDLWAEPEAVFASERFWSAMRGAYGLGFHKMALPEAAGGLGLDANTSGMVWEELGRWGPGFAASLMPAATVPRLIAFLAPDNQTLIERYLQPFCADERAQHISGWCSSEPEVGSDGKNYHDPRIRHRTRARKIDGGWVIDGAKSDFISNGGIASVHLVFACVEPEQGICGSGAFVVPADAPGVSTGKALDKTGLRTLNQAAVYFDGVEIPDDHLLFPHGEGYPMLHNAIITVGNLGVGYLALGLMRAAFEDALAHARERVQGGKPLLGHQLVADKLMRCKTALEAARAYLWRGSWLAATRFPGDLATSLSAKVFATEQAVAHTAEMVQVLGGYGISREYSLEKLARDAKLLRIMDGTNETLMLKAAEQL